MHRTNEYVRKQILRALLSINTPLLCVATTTTADGRRYKGEWRDGMAHGRGTETYPSGAIRHGGEWVNDEPVR